MQWLTRQGPFWEHARQHERDDWLECNGEIVTDTAVGEAAYCLCHGIDRAIVSMIPSSWLISPLSVEWHQNGHIRSVDVPNYWDPNELMKSRAFAQISLESWEDLALTARSRYPDLTFSPDSFEPLQGYPFGKRVAERLLSRLGVLHELKNCFDKHGKRTSEGHEIYQKHFTGAKAWFSDSSDSEKAEFRNDLIFPHPAISEEYLFCTWHGKIQTPPFRIHFSWPIRANEPLYIVYIGSKITKR